MSELELLIDVLTNQTESEADGVKYIYMDESTVYRFENNKMKKVSASMLKRARKSIETLNKQQQKQTKSKQKKPGVSLSSREVKPVKPASDDESEEVEEVEESEPVVEIKREPIEDLPKPIRNQIKRESSRKSNN